MRFSGSDQRALALWAADCAERVLPLFEQKYPSDDRPRKAIEAARSWTRGEIRVGEARAAAVAAHAAARAACESAARAAARSAGQAAGTPHMAAHARHAADYAVLAVAPGEAVGERDWQYQRLPEGLRTAIFPTEGQSPATPSRAATAG